MNEFITVFLFTDKPPLHQFLITIGLIVFCVAFILLTLYLESMNLKPTDPAFLDDGVRSILFVVVVGLMMFMFLDFAWNEYEFQRPRYNELLAIYDTYRYKVVEGRVQVLYIQPREGHTRGDIVRIKNVEFEIDYDLFDVGYHNSIEHNGVLTEGKYVRVYYYDETILQIDVKK